MKAIVRQETSRSFSGYQVLVNDQQKYRIEVYSRMMGHASIHIYQDVNSEIMSLRSNEELDRKLKARHPYAKVTLPHALIAHNNQEIGMIAKMDKKFSLRDLFGKSIKSWYQATRFDRDYLMYEVCCGAEGIKLPIYEGDTQIALIEKPSVIAHDKDIYEVHCLENCDLLISTIFAIYYDLAMSNNSTQFDTKTAPGKTSPKVVLEKYDKKFKAKC